MIYASFVSYHCMTTVSVTATDEGCKGVLSSSWNPFKRLADSARPAKVAYSSSGGLTTCNWGISPQQHSINSDVQPRAT